MIRISWWTHNLKQLKFKFPSYSCSNQLIIFIFTTTCYAPSIAYQHKKNTARKEGEIWQTLKTPWISGSSFKENIKSLKLLNKAQFYIFYRHGVLLFGSQPASITQTTLRQPTPTGIGKSIRYWIDPPTIIIPPSRHHRKIE